MWPFTRRALPEIEVAMADAVKLAALRWTAFCKISGLPANINLRDRVTYFAAEFRPEMARHFPALKNAPDELVLLIIAEGIELSGLEPRRQIERQLGIVLP